MASFEPGQLGTPFEKVVVVLIDKLDTPRTGAEPPIAELTRLVDTLGGKVVGTVRQRVLKPHPQFYIRPGKVEQVRQLCAVEEADTIVVDAPLSPTQVAKLEGSLDYLHVMDRRELILEIFARRAKTAEAKVQVELAYLDFVHPRMEGSGRGHREHRGGLRGAGASIVQQRTQVAKKRQAVLRQRLKKLKQQQSMRIQSRDGLPTVALVGYTNAGKSSLLRALSGDDIYADDLLFATLDTTTRRVYLPSNRNALVTDTVGFIQDLPHELVACFHSTLEEALHNQLLLHVVDAASPEREAQMKVVASTLEELQADVRPQVLVLNKIDRLDDDAVSELRLAHPEAVTVSAIEKRGLDALRERIDAELDALLPPGMARTG